MEIKTSLLVVIRSRLSRLLLGASFLATCLLVTFVLAGCGRQPAPAPVVLTQPPPSPAASEAAALPTPGPTASPAPLTASELAGRALAALQALEKSDIQFKSERSTLVDQTIVIDGQPQASHVQDVVSRSGFRLHGPDGLNASLRLAVQFPGSQNDHGLQGEARLAGGQIYLSAAYQAPQPGDSPLPAGWIRLAGPASELYWPGLSDFSDPDLYASLRGDVSELFTGRTIEQLSATITASLAGATLKEGKAKDGSPTEVITLSLKPEALLVSFLGIDPDDPALPRLAKAASGTPVTNRTPVTHRFILDQSGRLLSWDQAALIDIQDLDLTGLTGIPDGTKITLHANQRVSQSFSAAGAGLQPAAAPAEADLTLDPAYAGEASGEIPFRTLGEMDAALNAAVLSGDLDPFWAKVTALKQMPLIFGNTAVFFYRGPDPQVLWDGDWSGAIPNRSRHFTGTDLWLHTVALPSDARMEYQVWLGPDKPITDPLNPLVETGGLGSKSVVVMPGYSFPFFTLPQEGVSQGKLTENLAISSASLGYDVNYRVYIPSGYERLGRLPTLYVTDGQDFLQFGKMATVLDNLIAAGKVRPVLAVFIDPRDTKTGENQREKQFFDNPKYTGFIAKELVPAIDKAYRTNPTPDARALLGASNGGYFASTFALDQPGLFHLFGILSPNIAHNPAVLERFQAAGSLPIKVFLSVGAYRDSTADTRKLRDILQANKVSLQYVESNEGHSYGNWRGKFEELLAFFWAAQSTGAASPALSTSNWSPGQRPYTAPVEILGSDYLTHTVALDYLLYLPDSYGKDPQKKWPLILFLHGRGERGDDLELLKKHPLPKLLETRTDFPFIVVSPQRSLDSLSWSNLVEPLNDLLDQLQGILAIDSRRLYLTGLSMGGYGAWDFALRYPHRFAAVAPIAGGLIPPGAPANICDLKEVPIWAFHGAADTIVPPSESQVLVDALKACGSTKIRFSLYPGLDHEASFYEAYGDPVLYEWMLQQELK